MIERHVFRCIDKDPPGPTRSAPTLDLLDRGPHIPGRAQDDPADPVRIGPAVVIHPAVVGGVHVGFEADVIRQRPGAEPAGRQG